MRFKCWCLLVCVLCIAALLVACGGVEPGASIQSNVQWERDAREHWLLNDAGEKVDVAEHRLDEFMVCSVCGSEIWNYDDGTATIYNYNEYGEWLRITDVDAEGKVSYDITYEYKYDENGIKLWQKQYYNGVLAEEVAFRLNAQKECVPVRQTGYFDDGTVSVNEYDIDGNVVNEFEYDADGKLIRKTESKFGHTKNGDSYEMSSVTTYADGSQHVTKNDQYGNWVEWYECDAEGKKIYTQRMEYEYDGEGNTLWSKFYSNEVLCSESEYLVTVDGSYESVCTTYNEDGTKSVYEYDEDGEELSVTTYDADGNVIENPPEVTVEE